MTNAFNHARGIEEQGMEILLQHARQEGEVARLPPPLQKKGDIIITTPRHSFTAEIKVDNTPHLNFFFETWSNKKRGKRGWLSYLNESDALWYFFLQRGLLFRMRSDVLLYHLQRRITSYREVCQSKYSQKNDTWGRILPVSHVCAWMRKSMKVYWI